MNKVQLAVVGAGTIGRKHIETIAACADAELVAVVDPDTQVQNLAEENGAAFFTDLEAMLAALNPAAAIIATPTEHHLAPALTALAAGLHVLIEKPIAASNAEAEHIIAAADAAKRQVLVGHQRRYYPVLNKTREIVQGGGIGRLVAVNGQWTVLKADHYFDPEWRKQRAAGPVLTNLIHDIDALRYICGEIESVQAETSSSVRGYEKEDTAALIMRFANGALGTFILSDAAPSPWGWEFATGENPAFPASYQNCYRFMGTEASLEFPNLQRWTYAAGERGWNFKLQPTEIETEFCNAYARQCEHFCAVIRGQQEPRISARDGATSLRASLAVFAAVASGQRVLL